MADHTITISNTLNVFGMEPTNKWGTFEWGQNWGDGDIDLQTEISHLLISETVTLSDGWTFSFEKKLSDIISLDGDASEQYLTDSNGYNYVFTRPTTDAELRANTTYSEVAAIGSSWSEASGNTGGWTEQ